MVSVWVDIDVDDVLPEIDTGVLVEELQSREDSPIFRTDLESVMMRHIEMGRPERCYEELREWIYQETAQEIHPIK